MSILFADGFGYLADGTNLAADNLLSGYWTSQGSNISVTDLGDGRKSIKPASGYAPNLSKNLGSDYLTLVVHMFTHSDSATNGFEPLGFFDGAVEMGNIYIDATSNKLQYQTSTVTVAESTVAVPPNSTNHIAVKVYFHASAGTVDFWVNGVAAGSFTGLDTIYGGTQCDVVQLGKSNSQLFQFSDFVVDDADYLGELKVAYVPCDSAGSDSDFTPLSSTNQSNVDEIGPDENTTYNSSSTVGHRDSLGHSGISGTINSIEAVIGMVRARKEGGGASTMKVGVYRAASESQGSAEALALSYGWFYHITTVDPSTSVAWIEAGFNAAEGSYEKAA